MSYEYIPLSFQPYSENYFLDCLFSHFVVNSLVITAWAGMWILQYQHFFPHDQELGDQCSVAIGYGLCLLLYGVDAPLAAASSRLGRYGFYCRLAFEDFVVFCTFFSHCILWRGAWNCTARYIVPDLETGGWVCFVVGSVGLLTAQCMSYAGGMGCAIDGEAHDVDIFFQSRYLRHFCGASSEDRRTSPQNVPEKVMEVSVISKL